MECHDRLAAVQQRADETETEKPPAQHSSDMKVDDVVIQLRKKAHQSSGISGIVHVIGSRLAVPRNIDNGAGYALAEEESADRYEVALHSTVRWRIGA